MRRINREDLGQWTEEDTLATGYTSTEEVLADELYVKEDGEVVFSDGTPCTPPWGLWNSRLGE